MDSTLYNQEGSKVGKIELPDGVFALPWNATLVRDAVRFFQASRRAASASTKGRSEVRGGGVKPWRQKGTGRARHGSSRSPIWIGGGVTHGPSNEKEYGGKINKRARRKALKTVLSQKLRDGELVFIDELKLSAPKTKVAYGVIEKLRTVGGFEKLGTRGGRALVLIESPGNGSIRAMRNLPNVSIEEVRNINAEKAITEKYLIFTKNAVGKLTE